MKWNEEQAELTPLKERIDLPWFSTKLKLKNGRYQVKRIAFIKASQSWICETDYFKQSFKMDDDANWGKIDASIFQSEAIFIQVKDSSYGIVSAQENTPWHLEMFDKSEAYSTAMNYGNFLASELGELEVDAKLEPKRKTRLLADGGIPY